MKVIRGQCGKAYQDVRCHNTLGEYGDQLSQCVSFATQGVVGSTNAKALELTDSRSTHIEDTDHQVKAHMFTQLPLKRVKIECRTSGLDSNSV